MERGMQCFYYVLEFYPVFWSGFAIAIFFLILECSKRLDYNCRVEIKGRSFNTNFAALDNHNRTTLNPLIPLLPASKRKCCCEQ